MRERGSAATDGQTSAPENDPIGKGPPSSLPNKATGPQEGYNLDSTWLFVEGKSIGLLGEDEDHMRKSLPDDSKDVRLH